MTDGIEGSTHHKLGTRGPGGIREHERHRDLIASHVWIDVDVTMAGENYWPTLEESASWSDVRHLAMRHALVLSLLGALVPLVPLVPVASMAAPLCPDSLSTAEQTRCLMQALEASDRQLQKALMGVSQEAQRVPGPTFQTLWRENLTTFHGTSADPLKQAEAFRTQRRAVCAYAKSVGFQGTGYGIATTRCELALTRTLLDELRP